MSLVVQWLRLHTPNTGDLGSIPGQGARFHMPHTSKSLHAATKIPNTKMKLEDPECHS